MIYKSIDINEETVAKIVDGWNPVIPKTIYRDRFNQLFLEIMAKGYYAGLTSWQRNSPGDPHSLGRSIDIGLFQSIEDEEDIILARADYTELWTPIMESLPFDIISQVITPVSLFDVRFPECLSQQVMLEKGNPAFKRYPWVSGLIDSHQGHIHITLLYNK